MLLFLLGGGDLPSVRTLRDKYVPIIKKDYDAAIAAKLRDRRYTVLCDETTNRKGEAVLVTLLKALPTATDPEPFLVVGSVKVLIACNADQCSKAIIQVIKKIKKNVLLIKCFILILIVFLFSDSTAI